MKKILAVLLAVVLTLGISLPAFADDADMIIDGRGSAENIGTFSIDYAGGEFTVDFAIDPESDWELVETHVYIGDEPPAKHSPGQFPYTAGTIEYAAAAGATVYVAAHAEVQRYVETIDIIVDGVIVDTEDVYEYESVWVQNGNDTAIGKGKNWATYFVYTIPEPGGSEE